AAVAELADARGSGPRSRKGVGVRVPSAAPFFNGSASLRRPSYASALRGPLRPAPALARKHCAPPVAPRPAPRAGAGSKALRSAPPVAVRQRLAGAALLNGSASLRRSSYASALRGPLRPAASFNGSASLRRSPRAPRPALALARKHCASLRRSRYASALRGRLY